MNELERIKKLWFLFLETGFSDGERDTDKMFDLLEIDTYAAGCIDSFVRNDGVLDRQRISVLRECVNDLNEMMPGLSGKDVSYFAPLADLGARVLAYLEAQNPSAGD